MKLLSTYLVVMGTLVVAVMAAPIAYATGPTPAQLRALEIRGRAMDDLCVDSTLNRQAYVAVCGEAGAASRPTRSELRALEIRGQAMNGLCMDSTLNREAYVALCGEAGAAIQPTRSELQALEIRGQAMNRLGDTIPTAAPSSSSGGFEWTEFGIGAAAMLGLVLLAGGIVTGVHYGRRSSARPRTAP